MNVQQVFQTAVRHHHSGRLSEAKQLYHAILAEQPDHADALYLLGALAMQSNQPKEASEWFTRAIAARPTAEYCFDLGFSLAALGETQRAVPALQQAIELKPAWAAAHAYLGTLRQNLGELDEAVRCLQQAISLEPNNGEWHFNLGNAFLASEKHAESVEAFQRCLQLNPRHVGALSNLGNALRKLDRLEEAELSLRRALDLEPSLTVALHNLGCVLYSQNRYQESVTVLRQAIGVDPNLADVYNDLGISLHRLGQLPESIAVYRRGLELNPQWPEALSNLGAALTDLGQLDEAVSRLEQAVALKPELVSAHLSLGNALKDQGRLEQAIACYDRVLDMPATRDLAAAHWNRALAMLLQGDLARGWREYEWRWQWKEFKTKARDFPQARWQGEDLAGRTILITSEQGLGDMIQFVRYVPMVAQRGGRVLLECERGLMRLVRGVAGVERLVRVGEAPADFDLHCPLMSLPLAFSTTLETIPNQSPYLRADVQLVEKWRQRMAGDDSRMKVGLVWAGNPAHRHDHLRSLPSLELLKPLASAKGMKFYSLQKGVAAEEVRKSSFGLELVDWSKDLSDFAETAALIANLDLVIAPDTAIAHLAGAMGKRVWTMLPFSSEWRWLLQREDSPWYPTMRLFRQDRPRGWSGVVDRLSHALEHRVQLFSYGC
jgi:tetratricopeptide (TPR) repeat protein